MVECPVCVADIAPHNDTIAGELIDCNECGSELEVASINPVALREAPVAAEDWGQ